MVVSQYYFQKLRYIYELAHLMNQGCALEIKKKG